MKIRTKHILVFILGFLMTLMIAACTVPTSTMYTVTFNSHGGPSVASREVEAGSLLTEPSITRSGFTLDGWYKESSYTTKWVFASDKVEANITLHAKWTEDAPTEYTVTFNSNGGSTVANITKTSGQTLGTLPVPTKAGSTFIGWFSDSNLTQAVTASTAVTSNMTLYAKWEVNAVEFTVTFNALPGDVFPATRTVADGALVLEPSAEYEGYELVGWYKEASFITLWDFAVDTVESNMTLYARWELIPEGTAITSEDQFYELINGTTVYETGAIFYLRNNLDFTDFDWDGSLLTETLVQPHTFVLNGNGKTISNLSFETPNQAGLVPRMSGGSIYDLTLENVHVKGTSQGGILVGRIMNGSTVSIHDITIIDSSVETTGVGSGGLIGHIQGAATPSTVTVDGIVLKGVKVLSNSNAAGGLVGDVESSVITITNVLLDVEVTTTGERVGGILGEVRRNSGGLRPEFSVDNAVVYANLHGMRYLGGVVGRADNNLTQDNEFKGTIGTITDVILVLNFDTTHETDNNSGHIARSNITSFSRVYVVAFNYDRQQLNGVNTTNELVFANISLLPETSLAEFADGWVYVEDALPTFNGLSIDLGFEVTLSVNDVNSYQYVRENSKLSPVFVNPELGAFLGFYLNDVLFESEVTEDITLVAKFVEEFAVTFDVDGGSSVTAQTVLDGAKALLPTAPTKDGYTFDGWYTSAEFTTLFDFDAVITTDVIVYAKWVDDIAPVVTVLPESGSISLGAEDTFVLTVQVSDVNAYSLEVDHSLEANLPEFTVYAVEVSETNPYGPYGSLEAKNQFDALGVTVTYTALTQTFTIDFGATVTDMFVDSGITFYLVATDSFDNAFGSMNPTTAQNTFAYDISVVTVSHVVSFDVDGATAIEDIEVLDGEALVLPPAPFKPGFEFKGWFTDSEKTVAFVLETPITADLTLYAKFEEMSYVPEGTAISTVEEFYNMVNGVAPFSLSESYYLANDLDFTGYSWVWQTGKVFTGVLDGNFKTISNLTIEGTQDRVGIWYGLRGTVKNIEFINAAISSTAAARAGLIAGEITNVDAVLQNIHVDGLTVTGASNNGVGGLIGYVNRGTTVEDISIKNAVITGTQATGGLFGRVGDGSAAWNMSVTNIYLENVSVSGTNRVGGLFGENNGASGYIVITLSKVVMVDVDVNASGTGAGAVSGRHNPNPTGTGTLLDVYFNGTVSAAVDVAHITTTRTYETITNFWFYGTLTGPVNGTTTTNILEVAPTQSWWDLNFENAFDELKWEYDATLNVYQLRDLN